MDPSDRPVPGEPVRSPSLNLIPEQAQELVDLARQLDEGRAPARPKSKSAPPSREEASARSRAYWSQFDHAQRRIKTLRARIGVGKAAERELQDLLQDLQAQHDAGEAEGGAS